jgi:hypothetical protein
VLTQMPAFPSGHRRWVSHGGLSKPMIAPLGVTFYAPLHPADDDMGLMRLVTVAPYANVSRCRWPRNIPLFGAPSGEYISSGLPVRSSRAIRLAILSGSVQLSYLAAVHPFSVKQSIQRRRICYRSRSFQTSRGDARRPSELCLYIP